MDQLKSFWEQMHQERNGRFLTGSDPATTYQQHGVLDLVASGTPITVLEVGVGLGVGVRSLAALGHTVIACDISATALGSVADVAAMMKLPWQLKDLEPSSIDLAMAHLVAQHVPDDDWLGLMRGVVRLLKTDAFFSFQYTERVLPEQSLPPEFAVDEALGIAHFRSPARVADMVTEAGGAVIWHSPSPMKFTHVPQMQWHFVHVGRRD
jgi:SAM-dependent methyltransferase